MNEVIINKATVIRMLAASSDFTKAEVKTLLDLLRDLVYDTMADGKSIKPFDGVTFTGKFVGEHETRNPQNGETVKVASKMVPKLKFGTYAKAAINSEE